MFKTLFSGLAHIVLFREIWIKQSISETTESNPPIYDALRNLVPFVQFKKREKHPWRSVIFSKIAG